MNMTSEALAAMEEELTKEYNSARQTIAEFRALLEKKPSLNLAWQGSMSMVTSVRPIPTVRTNGTPATAPKRRSTVVPGFKSPTASAALEIEGHITVAKVFATLEARGVKVHRSSVAEMLYRMEKARLIHRVEVPDSRRAEWVKTLAGAETISTASGDG